MNTLNAILAVSSMITCLIFCVMGCSLVGNENFWTERTKTRVTRFNIVVGIITILAFGYTMIRMQFDAVNQSEFVTNVICSIFATLLLGGIGWFLLSLNEIPILKSAHKGLI